MDKGLGLLRMSFELQISNVGSEVHRAIRYRNSGDERGKIEFCNVAIAFLETMKEDPKNVKRIEELDYRIEELKDYFLGDKSFGTTDEKLIEYYDAYIFDDIY